MALYPNGQIPFDVLVHLGGEHYLTPATAVKWRALQQDVWENEGVWLQISSGANGYRWLEKQEEAYEDSAPGNAAYPGTSSHGGEYNGRDSMAIDVGNWGLLGRDLFYYYARKHGFQPNYFDWEPWHIIDWDPWAAVPASGGSAKPIPEEESEEDDMPKNSGFIYQAASQTASERTVLICNYGSGFYHEYTNGVGSEDSAYNSAVAKAFDIPEAFAPITHWHADTIKRSLKMG